MVKKKEQWLRANSEGRADHLSNRLAEKARAKSRQGKVEGTDFFAGNRRAGGFSVSRTFLQVAGDKKKWTKKTVVRDIVHWELISKFLEPSA